MKYLVAVLTAVVSITAFAWECPRCELENQGDFCSDCDLLEPPASMTFVPACRVELEGVTIDVESFYIDSFPVSYRQILPWMDGVIGSPEDLAAVITGQFDENYQFLSFTPFVNSEDGTALTVPSDCFGLPAASFTWEGASLYLRDQGKQLPTIAQLLAAQSAGVLEEFDVYTVMSTYSDVMTASMGNLLGNISHQSMFAGHSTSSERIMWEWARNEWGRQQDETIDMTGRYRVLFKSVDPVQLGAAGRNMGYFNVIFRGVVELPMEWQ